MIKSFAKSLTVAVYAVGLTLVSCSKPNDVVPVNETPVATKPSQSTPGVTPDNSGKDNDTTTTTNPVTPTVPPVTTTPITTSPTTLSLGVNGHPFGDAPYLETPATRQVDMINQMGMNWYRINVLTQSDGTISGNRPGLFEALRDAAKSGSVNLLPMLYLRTFKSADSPETAYEKGRTLGANFAAKYGEYFEYYDLGNDLELDLLLPNTDGRDIADYNPTKSKAIAYYLKGMDEGIKANDPGAKTMIDAGWLHWGFLTICSNYGVQFDAIGYHWYSDMEGAAKKSYKIDDITTKITGLFPTKELWFTEFGYRYNSSSNVNEDKQSEFINSFVAKCRNNTKVKAAIAYELLDEPYKSYQESNYGLYKWLTRYTSSAKKPVVSIFR
ncbi:hypothetical protein IM792_07535 [Mucilaginibacter sp. JRF]|uniref:glycosyl hydrolase n=1 Tax=Mucilaginibacter sp. JRF TaxID=2780088 RepID=UPI0018802C5E|nr:glycosyl hydrolase [Mucilaginibacter sp. JRF]MBE9584294.1 hypothetical protein [Mucilaginibacter sp. JRF]